VGRGRSPEPQGRHAHAPQLDATLTPHPEAPLTATGKDVGTLPFDEGLAAARAAGCEVLRWFGC
jgi:hypothetical protein